MLFVSSWWWKLGCLRSLPCFNLGIEMLFVSSVGVRTRTSSYRTQFQSRNRDAFRFKLALKCHRRHRCISFNLGIEMLFVSRGSAVSVSIRFTSVSISESRCFSFQVRPFGSLTVRALIGSDSARDTFQDARR